MIIRPGLQVNSIGEGTPVPPSPPPPIQHLEWEEGGTILPTLSHKFLYTRQRLQKRIPRRRLGFSLAVNNLRFLNNCVGLLHILCRNFGTHQNV